MTMRRFSRTLASLIAPSVIVLVASYLVGCGTMQRGQHDALSQIEARAKQAGVVRPIVDTHIHLYQVTRPGGVPWPPRAMQLLYRDVLPADYQRIAQPLGIVAAFVIEASPLVDDNQWVLDLVRGNDFFPVYIGDIEVGSPGFLATLDRFARDPRFVGIRHSREKPLSLDETQRAHLRALAERGMVLELLTRDIAYVTAVAQAAPNLKIVANHMLFPKVPDPDPAWTAAMQRLAASPNVHVKFGNFAVMYRVKVMENWNAPTALSAYKPAFDALFAAFGSRRLMFDSNWPVIEMGATTLSEQVRLAEEYLEPLGRGVRDDVMYRNAIRLYSRGAATP